METFDKFIVLDLFVLFFETFHNARISRLSTKYFV